MQFEPNQNLFHAGKSGGGKAKNKPSSSGKAQDGAVKTSYHIPRLNPLFELESEDEDLGWTFANSSSNVEQFSGKATREVASMLNSAKLLSESMVGLSQDLEKLIIYSASKQTWARHTSAWKLYADFCENFKINFYLTN